MRGTTPFEYFNLDPTRSFETRQTEPEGAPEKLYAEPLSDDRIQVVWSPLNAHAWNGDPLGYLIMYRPAVTRRLGSPTKHSDEKEKVDVVDWVRLQCLSQQLFLEGDKNVESEG